jgi:methyltransferase (TIGR00027 family)
MPSLIETARWVAALRARESERPDRLFSDPLAVALAGEEGLSALRLSEKYNPRHQETANYLSIRIRLFDEIAQDSAARGIRQIVLPAAGMDARAYRFSWPDGTTFYELDQPELLATKEKILEGQSLARKCKRVAIGADLKEDWAHLLLDSGFAAAERSMWLIEGFFYYLEEPAVNHVLKEVSGLAAPGSVAVTDLVSQKLLRSPWMQPALKAMEERGMAWRFGTDDPVGLFAKHGWKAEIKEPREEGARFDVKRFPVKPGQTWSFFVVAQKGQAGDVFSRVTRAC